MAGRFKPQAMVTIIVKEIVDGLGVEVGRASILDEIFPWYLVPAHGIPLQPKETTSPIVVDVYANGVKIGHGTVFMTLYLEAIDEEAVAKVIENAIDREEDKGTKKERIDYSN